MKLIVAVDEEWGIGNNNNLLFNIPEDMAYFKSNTINNTIIMGRKTFESLPNKKPLPNRLNIILTSKNFESKENMIICNSLTDVFNYLKSIDTDNTYVIGGGEIYKQLLNYCSEALVTKVYSNVEKNVFFPNLDELNNWEIVDKSDIKEYKGTKYQFIRYKNNSVLHY